MLFMARKNKKLRHSKSLFLVFLLVFLRPHSDLLGSFFAVYGGDLILFGFLVFFAIFLKAKNFNCTYLSESRKISFFILLFSSIVILFHFDIRVVAEYGKFIYYYLFTCLISILFISRGVEFHHKFNEFLDFIFVLIGIIAFSQLFELPIVNSIFGIIWGTDKLRGISTFSPRVYSSFYNSNWFGVVMGMLLLLYIRRLLILNLYKINNFIFCVMAFCLLLMSGSRSAFLATGLCVLPLILQLINQRNKKSNTGAYIFLILSIIIFLSFIPFIWPKLSQNRRVAEVIAFSGNRDISEISSGASRVDSWNRAALVLSENIFLGVGGEAEKLSPHNSFLYLSLLFGSLGAFLLILSFYKNVISIAIELKSRPYDAFPLYMMIFLISFTGEYLVSTQIVLSFMLILICWNCHVCSGST